MNNPFPAATTERQRAALQDFTARLHQQMSKQIVATLLIGSVARGDFGPGSDIDVFVIGENVDTAFKASVWAIGSDVSLAHNVLLNIHIQSRARWDKMRRERSLLWQTVQREGIALTPAAVQN